MSLGRNNTNNLNELEVVGDTLEELWIPYNFIEKLKGIHVMKKLKILYMSNNLVKDWGEAGSLLIFYLMFIENNPVGNKIQLRTFLSQHRGK